MTEIALHTESAAAVEAYQPSPIARLQAWAGQADNAVRYAEVVVNTAMCPQAYRGRRDEAAAAILAGAELDFDPMASLRAFHSIQGTPTLKAEAVRAIVQRRGHDLVIIESDDRHCIVEGRRKGSDQWQRTEWTIERATKAGYTKKNPNWQSNPNAMLIARATTEVGRWIASDAIMGVPVSEEIADQGAEVQVPTRRVTAADIVTAAVEHQEQLADEDQIEQIRGMFTDPNLTLPPGTGQREFVTDLVGHDLLGLHELTVDEADKVINALAELADQQ
jgi:hypothetical protein